MRMHYSGHKRESSVGVVDGVIHKTSLNALKKKVTKKWNKIPTRRTRVIRDSCRASSKRLQQVLDNLPKKYPLHAYIRKETEIERVNFKTTIFYISLKLFTLKCSISNIHKRFDLFYLDTYGDN